jgi:hypothetical protein
MFDGSNNTRRPTVFAKLAFGSALAALICIIVGSTTNNASAVSVEVARKCTALTAKAYPPRVIGNPAAGSTKGTGRVEQDYFKRCVANGGNVADDDARKEEK